MPTFNPPPPTKYVEAEDLEIGKQYWKRSGLGGVFTLTYEGLTEDGLHIFTGFFHDDPLRYELPSIRINTAIEVCYNKLTREEYDQLTKT